MKDKTEDIFTSLYKNFPALKEFAEEIESAFSILSECYRMGNKVLVCGNGGSAADSEHIVGELMKGFRLQRPLSASLREKIDREFQGENLADYLQGALPAISLTSQAALMTAFNNDVSPDTVFAQQVLGYGKCGDVLIGITTSGNSRNVVNAVKVAKVLGMKTIGVTGAGGGILGGLCDVTIAVPERETYRIQELHLPVYHALCAAVENEQFGF
ncbi:MAG: SIS domain-containing protein [Clostridiales bacterium]|nr:SIS domain-containing protein [Clostridiales bacterium]MDU3240476.1 SIS domain-containing protein [Clostridiales bacterium]